MSKIIGNTTTTPVPRSDWAQTDETKVDFILNKPELGTLASQDEVAKSNLAPDVQTLLAKADTALQSYTETDPTVPAWAKAATKPTYTAAEVGADPSGSATSAVSGHNTATNAHNDIRLLVEGLTTRLNTLADSDDKTLDQMSEIVAYIKSNKDLIDSITTSKVNVSDIIDNLTTNVTNKPLSAAQGVALKALLDALQAEVDKIGNNFIINATIDANGDGTVDKTAAEITAALEAGHTMVCNAAYGTSTALIQLPLFSSGMASSTILRLVFANQNYKVAIRIVDGNAVNVSGEIINFDITIGDTTWSGDEAIDFTDTINGMIDAKQVGNIFIAEYGTTTFNEIFEAVQTNGKTAFCRTSTGSTLPLAYAHIDEIKFVGNTFDGEQEAICTMDNVWSLNDVEEGTSTQIQMITWEAND